MASGCAYASSVALCMYSGSRRTAESDAYNALKAPFPTRLSRQAHGARHDLGQCTIYGSAFIVCRNAVRSVEFRNLGFLSSVEYTAKYFRERPTSRRRKRDRSTSLRKTPIASVKGGVLEPVSPAFLLTSINARSLSPVDAWNIGL